MSPDSKSSGRGWLRKNIYQPLHPITKGSPGKCHPPAKVAEIDQEAYWHQATQKAEWEKCSLSHKPSVTHTPSGTPRGLRNPFCPHGITSREWGIRKMLHPAIINYLEANEKNIKSQQRNRSMEKNQMELSNGIIKNYLFQMEKTKKWNKTLLNGLNTGMEKTEKRINKLQDI